MKRKTTKRIVCIALIALLCCSAVWGVLALRRQPEQRIGRRPPDSVPMATIEKTNGK